MDANKVSSPCEYKLFLYIVDVCIIPFSPCNLSPQTAAHSEIRTAIRIDDDVATAITSELRTIETKKSS
jgi:hypothetical protein